MSQSTTTVLLIVACVYALAAARSSAQDTLVWSDEFNGSSIDPANWEHQIGNGASGWGNNELQYYTDRPENSYVSGGYLHIVARNESYMGYSYTSARLRTLNRRDFLYGKMEARIKLPRGQGIWPAFWMMPTDAVYGGWASSGEVDILESIGDAMTAYGTLIYGGPWPNQVYATGTQADGTDYSQDFHVYTLEWEPDVFRWRVDGIWYHFATSGVWYSEGAPDNDRAPFDQFFHFILNVAVGGNWPGYPDGSTQFPQEMLIDWVRVYQDNVHTPFYGDPHPVPGVIEVEDFDLGIEGVAYHDCDPQNNGGAYRPYSWVDIELCAEGGFNVGWICEGEWLEFTVDVAFPGTYTIDTRVASANTGGSFHIEFDGVDSTGSIAVPITGGWQNWVTVGAVAELSTGLHEMRFVSSDSTTDEYNVNYFNLISTCLSGDFDCDGDIDLLDFAVMAGCTGGPGNAVPPVGCTQVQFEQSDLDDDTDVDVRDFVLFQAALSQ